MRWKRFLPGLLGLAIAGLAYALGILAPAERIWSDLRTEFYQHEVTSDVVIVAIDAHSLQALNQWPWSRAVHARLVERLDELQPASVFLDVDFSLPSGDAAADRRLAEVVGRERSYPLVLPAFWQKASAATAQTRVLTQPLAELAAHSKIALVNVSPAADGLVRDALHLDVFGHLQYQSVASVLTDLRDLEPGRLYPIDYSISPDSFSFVSYADVLQGTVPAEQLRNKRVFVGATAEELGDVIPVPLHRSLAGVTVQAILYETLRQGIPAASVDWLVFPLLLGLALLWVPIAGFGWRGQLIACAVVTMGVLSISLAAEGSLGVRLDGVPLVLMAVSCTFFGIIALANRETLDAMLVRMRLRQERALISGVLNASIDGILVTDAGGIILDVNPAAEMLFGVERATLLGTALGGYLPGLKTTGDGIEQGRTEIVLEAQRGRCPVEISVSPVTTERESMATVIVRDISERRRQQAVLRHQATHDPLTGLPNRNLLAKFLARLSKHRRAALLMLDLDGFKKVNDTLGHKAGDEALRELGKRLRGNMPKGVRVFRIGGDEFAVLALDYVGRAALDQLAGKILQLVRAPLPAATARVELGGSIGIALYPIDAREGGLLLQYADVAMYSAKSRRGGTEYYDAASDNNTVRNLKMTGALRRALDEQRLDMVYQPKVRLSDGRCLGVEALVRWDDPELGIVSPDEFVPLAETCELIEPLTRFTLTRTLQDYSRWCARGIELQVSVNLSARHVHDAAFGATILEMLEARGIKPEALELEITETALMDEPEKAQRVLQRLSSRGIRLAMDDFGTGFSSLAYLKHLDLQTLKIDRCFVQDLCTNASDRKIVASTLSMAHSLDLEVVAEGIENAQQAKLLEELGCDIGQGYHFAKPMQAADLADWVAASKPSRTRLYALRKTLPSTGSVSSN